VVDQIHVGANRHRVHDGEPVRQLPTRGGLAGWRTSCAWTPICTAACRARRRRGV